MSNTYSGIKKDMKVGEIFSDTNGLKYKVIKVNDDGTYISALASVVSVIDNAIDKVIEEVAEEVVTEEKPKRKPRTAKAKEEN